MTAPIITLTTDFGLDDCYVGVMKGVILSRNPSAQIIDLCHSIPPQDILQAASMVHANFGYFPQGTVHVVIVDPGVGSNRKIIMTEACGHRFLAPDNGVLTHLIHNNLLDCAYIVNNDALYLTPTSQTFHGRDIFAPVAAFLTDCDQPDPIGPACDIDSLVRLDLPLPRIDTANSIIEGTIINIDHFGNLVTNITLDNLGPIKSPKTVAATINGHTITGLQENYAAISPGKPLLLINSQNSLEIAVNQGNAQITLNASIGDTILLKTT